MREHKIGLDEAMPLVLEKLAGGQEVLFSPSGTSMLPTLMAGRDTVVLVAPPPALKKYDIALYRRKDGRYVLHRVIGCGKTYTFAGDNQAWYERNVEPTDILALCIAYVQDGKRVRLDSFASRMRARRLHLGRRVRRVYRGVLRRIASFFKGTGKKER